MGSLNKYSRNNKFDNDEIYVVLFVSRNKDNKHLENFKERRMSFITHDKTSPELTARLEHFVRNGQYNEFSRAYISVNPRSSKKTFKALQHLMLDQEFHIGLIEPKLASIAAKHENILDSKKRKVLFDFDKSEDHDLILHLDQFEKDIKEIDKDIELLFIRTPNGFSVIPNKRFDTRELLKKYPNMEVKRDDSYCFNYKYNV